MSYRQLTHRSLDRIQHIDAAIRRGEKVNYVTVEKVFEGVSRDTILRDVAYMRDRLDRPIEFNASRNTYYYTELVGPLPTMIVSEGEMFALLVARKALEQYRGTPFHRQLAVSFEKFAAGMKDQVSFSPDQDAHSVSFKNIGTVKIDPVVFKTISRGVLRRREVEFDYRKPGDRTITRRHVQPYHLSYRENLCYLVGFDHDRGALRTFALPRITRPALTDCKFTVPSGFSAEKYFSSALGAFGGEGNYRIVIRFKPAAADRIRERDWHDSQKMRDRPDGGLDLELRLGALPEVERWILQWGTEAEVLQPKELRKSIAAVATRLAKIYRSVR